MKFENLSVHLSLGWNAESHQIGYVGSKSVPGSQDVWTVIIINIGEHKSNNPRRLNWIALPCVLLVNIFHHMFLNKLRAFIVYN